MHLCWVVWRKLVRLDQILGDLVGLAPSRSTFFTALVAHCTTTGAGSIGLAPLNLIVFQKAHETLNYRSVASATTQIA